MGTDNEKGKLFRFLPLIPLLALGARLEGRGTLFLTMREGAEKIKAWRPELLRWSCCFESPSPSVDIPLPSFVAEKEGLNGIPPIHPARIPA